MCDLELLEVFPSLLRQNQSLRSEHFPDEIHSQFRSQNPEHIRFAQIQAAAKLVEFFCRKPFVRGFQDIGRHVSVADFDIELVRFVEQQKLLKHLACACAAKEESLALLIFPFANCPTDELICERSVLPHFLHLSLSERADIRVDSGRTGAIKDEDEAESGSECGANESKAAPFFALLADKPECRSPDNGRDQWKKRRRVFHPAEGVHNDEGKHRQARQDDHQDFLVPAE